MGSASEDEHPLCVVEVKEIDLALFSFFMPQPMCNHLAGTQLFHVWHCIPKHKTHQEIKMEI